MDTQEKYLSETSTGDIVIRGIRKLVTELTSIKTMFIATIFVGIFYGKINDLVGLVIGLAALGVKEIPPEIFTGLIQKFTGKT